MTDDPLELEWYVYVDILVEARLYGTEAREGRPVIVATRRPRAEFRFPPRQLLGLPF